MSMHVRPVRFALGATIGLGLLLGTACGGGTGTDKGMQAASVASAAADAPPPTEPPTTEPPTTVPVTAAPTTTAKPVTARAATPPTQAQSATTAATAAPATAPPATAAPVTVPARPNPSTPEVLAAIAQFKTKVPLFSPTEAQARQFGDMVCDAFDAGQTYAQIKAAALAQVASVPLVSISSADADFILKTAVKLFCPVYSSKLP